jgi:hypothetical protein
MKVQYNGSITWGRVLEGAVKIRPNRLLTIGVSKQSLEIETARNDGWIVSVDFTLNINPKFSQRFVYSIFSQNLSELIENLKERE